jgi:2-oxoglutarate ferredoxin oxidoreductase subunit alpha
MVEHYAAKIEIHADRIAMVKEDLQDGAETLVISYGITSRSARIAVERARAQGLKVSSLVLQTLWPTPISAIRKALQGIKRLIVPEMNLGQYRYELERIAPDFVQIIGVNRMDTTLISPQEILDMMEVH